MLLHFSPNDIKEFWSYVDTSGGQDSCWPWTRGCSGEGYGTFYMYTGESTRTVGVGAHRIAKALSLQEQGLDGVIIELLTDVLTCHDCPNGDNRKCCNPAHLFLGTKGDNNRDAYAKGRIVAPGLFGEIH